MRVWPGHPYPLGASWDGEGVNFALFSENATGVELCLFDITGRLETHRIPLRERTSRVWHCYIPDLRPGAMYGFRVHGPYDPERGQRFNPHKLLIDPYARAISGPVDWDDALFGYRIGDPQGDLSFDERDSAPYVPKSVVVESAFTWGDDRPPRIPWNRTLIYECHVKGMTINHPEVPPELQGTYLGLASQPIIEHLKSLGVTAVELMPVHQFLVDRHLWEQKLTNFWGYHSIGFFAPDVRYACHTDGRQVSEFKTMVKRFHSAGIEVLLDVVYNHTGEGSHLGPTICLRGADNLSYYKVNPDHPRYYVDYTGCGNSMNMLHSRTIQLIMDSLRYWVQEMHVDGFRFDLAPTLARELHEVNRLGRFFAIIQQDPIISQAKLIAEPWDLGYGGYQVGRFPSGWAEWNGKYRDTVRRYWRGDGGQVGEFAYRLSGSSDIYQHERRHTYGSINFVACHDGFTLHDLVSYEHKHNEANGEQNRDGHNANFSRNWGVEGPSDDPRIESDRERAKRNFLATLAFSQGVPMITAGDEFGRTQRGNNNAYCQDNDISWIDWNLDPKQREQLRFTIEVMRIRREYPVLRRRSFFFGEPVDGDGERHVKDLAWYRADGLEMGPDDWRDPERRTLGMLIAGEAADEVDEHGRRISGNALFLISNAGMQPIEFSLPMLVRPGLWRELVNTTAGGRRWVEDFKLPVPAYTLILLEYKEA